MKNNLNGQWMGRCEGTNTGFVVLNVDELSACYQGWAYLLDDNKAIPGTAIYFKTADKNNNLSFHTKLIRPIDPVNGAVVSAFGDIKHHYPDNVIIPSSVEVKGDLTNDILKISWKTDIGTNGKCDLMPSRADRTSELQATNYGWNEFKEHIAPLAERRLLFRGQRKQWRLRTTYHRTGRADLNRYLDQDIPALHKHLSGKTKHFFNLKDSEQNGAFYNLVQHHGYPTPLLDWTYSPYVAAFFAYRKIKNKDADQAKPDEKVRIHVFDQERWNLNVRNSHLLTTTFPNFCVEEFLSVENQRMIPQQSVSILTNLDDIESYIKAKEKSGQIYLRAIDLPVSERRKAMRELTYMGITAGALFPGLDGACEEFRERNFDI